MCSSVATELARLRASLACEFPVQEPIQSKPTLEPDPASLRRDDDPFHAVATVTTGRTCEGREYFLDMAARIKARRATAMTQMGYTRAMPTDNDGGKMIDFRRQKAQSRICPSNASPAADIDLPWKTYSDHAVCGVNRSGNNSPEDRHTPSTGITRQEAYYLQGLVGDCLRERIERKFRLLESEKKCRNASKTRTVDAEAFCPPAVHLSKSVSCERPPCPIQCAQILSLSSDQQSNGRPVDGFSHTSIRAGLPEERPDLSNSNAEEDLNVSRLRIRGTLRFHAASVSSLKLEDEGDGDTLDDLELRLRSACRVKATRDRCSGAARVQVICERTESD